jgi:stearoyl-CoA desaturase (Delta-9 desaturase)
VELASQPRPTQSDQINRSQLLERRVAWVVVVGPLIAFLIAVACMWDRGVGGLELGLCLVLSVVTIMGVTAGYHRLFTHQSFKAHPVVRAALGIVGSMAAQGPLLFWVACHRRHHQHSDTEEDPHSPWQPERGGIGILAGMWHSHVGWMFRHEPEPWGKYVPDLLRDDLAFRINTTYPIWVVVGLFLPAAIGWAIRGFAGVWTAFLWGGPVRIFLVHHITWSVNSLCHITGGAPFETCDESRNNAFCAVLALGEGWHNNHHAFPTSARHGLTWWQLDVTYLFIRLMAALGLAWDVKRPSFEAMAAKRRMKRAKTAPADRTFREGTQALLGAGLRTPPSARPEVSTCTTRQSTIDGALADPAIRERTQS